MTQSRTSFPFTPLSVKKSLKIRPVGGRTIRNLFVFKVGANPSEICLFFKVGANPSENFWNLTLEAFLSDSILLKNEARWVKKASSAPNGGSLMICTRKSRKAEHGTCEIFQRTSVGRGARLFHPARLIFQ